MRELRDFGIRILVDNVLYLAPFHFFTVFVKERTFLFIFQCRFAYKTWFSALWIDADHSTRISINALRLVFKMLCGHQYVFCCFKVK
jgi:hypothetical protein